MLTHVVLCVNITIETTKNTGEHSNHYNVVLRLDNGGKLLLQKHVNVVHPTK